MTHIDWLHKVPFSKKYDDIYFSAENGLAESTHVFLDANDLPNRLFSIRNNFNITEFGFGSGLNLFNLINTIAQTKNLPKFQLNFHSCEAFPLSKKDIKQALAIFPELTKWVNVFVELYDPNIKGWQIINIPVLNIKINIFHGLIQDMLMCMHIDTHKISSLADSSNTKPTIHIQDPIDAWFLDGFAPSKNPAMWQPELFKEMARLSKKDSTLSSFTAAGQVRRDLIAAGFQIKKIPGYGRKREMIQGKF